MESGKWNFSVNPTNYCRGKSIALVPRPAVTLNFTAFCVAAWRGLCALIVLLSFPSTAFVIYVSLWNPRRGDNLIGAGDRTNPNAKRGLSPAPNGFPLIIPLGRICNHPFPFTPPSFPRFTFWRGDIDGVLWKFAFVWVFYYLFVIFLSLIFCWWSRK